MSLYYGSFYPVDGGSTNTHATEVKNVVKMEINVKIRDANIR